MAIYHLSVKTIGRSEGRSATAAAAYRSGDRIMDERTGVSHDYTRRSGVEHTEIFLPQDAPKWAGKREQLWNVAEAAEKRINSTVAREFEVALPAELTGEQRCELVREFAVDIVKRHGLAVDVAIHKPGRKGDSRNYHAHILCSTRRLGPEGFTEKSRELDDRKSGEVGRWRKRWEEISNKALERARKEIRIDHRSLSAQGIEREPTIHQGVHATAMERRVEKARESGKVLAFPLPDRCVQNREIAERNEEVRKICAQIIDLGEARKRVEAEQIEAEKKETAAKAEKQCRKVALTEALKRLETEREEAARAAEEQGRIFAAGITFNLDENEDRFWIDEVKPTGLDGYSLDDLRNKLTERTKACEAEIWREAWTKYNEAIERLNAKEKELANHEQSPPKENKWRLTNAKYLRDMANWEAKKCELQEQLSALNEDLIEAQKREDPGWQTGEVNRRTILRNPELASEVATRLPTSSFPELVWDIKKKSLADAIRLWAIQTKPGIKAELEVQKRRQADHEKQCPPEPIFSFGKATKAYEERYEAWKRQDVREWEKSWRLEKRLKLIGRFAKEAETDTRLSNILRIAEPRLAAALDQAREEKERERQKELQEEIERERKQKAEEERIEAERRRNAPPRELAAALREAAANESSRTPFEAVLQQYPQLAGAVAARNAIAQDQDFQPDRGQDNSERLALATEEICDRIARGERLQGAKDPQLEQIKEMARDQYEEWKQEQELDLDEGPEIGF